MPTEGSDLLQYYPNNGSLNLEGGLGYNEQGQSGSPIIPSNPEVKVGVNTDPAEACNYCLNLSYGAKLLLGVEGSIKVGFSEN